MELNLVLNKIPAWFSYLWGQCQGRKGQTWFPDVRGNIYINLHVWYPESCSGINLDPTPCKMQSQTEFLERFLSHQIREELHHFTQCCRVAFFLGQLFTDGTAFEVPNFQFSASSAHIGIKLLNSWAATQTVFQFLFSFLTSGTPWYFLTLLCF